MKNNLPSIPAFNPVIKVKPSIHLVEVEGTIFIWQQGKRTRRIYVKTGLRVWISSKFKVALSSQGSGYIPLVYKNRKRKSKTI